MKIQIIFPIILAFILTSCAPVSTPAPTETPPPTPIPPTATVTLIPTRTPVPITYVTLGSPFATDCGDGIPRIWASNAYNGVWYPKCNDDSHGHNDWYIPSGCNVDKHVGDIVSPINGTLQPYNDDQGLPLGVHIVLDKNEYPVGILDALTFAGINSPSLDKVTEVAMDYGHMTLTTSGHVTKGQIIGESDPFLTPKGTRVLNVFAAKVNVQYAGVGEIVLAANLFPTELVDGTILLPMLDGTSTNWICMDSSYDCIPEAGDYSPRADCVAPK